MYTYRYVMPGGLANPITGAFPLMGRCRWILSASSHLIRLRIWIGGASSPPGETNYANNSFALS